MTLRIVVATIILAICAAALTVSLRAKPIIPAAEATMIVCNPVFVPGIPKQRKIVKA